MILIDYNAVAISNIFALKIEVEESMIRHMILTSIKMYNKKFKKEYGPVVICADHGGVWRKDFYEHYKANRKTDRDASELDWEELFRIINLIREEIVEHMPWKVLHIHRCEADDIIGVLADYTQEFGNYEKVMIVSADRDFAQLQKYDNISQFSTNTKKLIVEKSPQEYLFTHICKGDAGDGVPNIKSADDFLIDPNSGRAPPISKKELEKWQATEDLENALGPELWRNFQRNQRMVDLSFTPDVLRKEIINKYVNQDKVPNSKVLPYLISKRCRNLIGSVNEFF